VLRARVAGIEFANPLGLAAGYDKNGRAVRALAALGFGHVEIGSISGWPSSGNPRPRLFRLPQEQAIVVHYGVPNEGAAAVAQRLRGRSFSVPVGINLVKTNDPARPACDEEVFNDFARSLAELKDCGSYLVLSLSCPNSPGDRDFFDDTGKIDLLLARVASLHPGRPVFLKMKPTGDEGRLKDIVEISRAYPFVAGLSINLPAGKPAELGLRTPAEMLARMPGAVGGKPVEAFINRRLAQLYPLLGNDGRFVLMAAGGVFTAADAYRKVRLGASLVQLYTGLIYRGPRIVREILQGLVRLLEADGFRHVSEAVGADLRHG
jgi:dihydroorotate dehydrogenase (fumarate)/dihydroorotate dehydrogenase